MNKPHGVCIRQTELPGIRPLFAGLLYRFQEVEGFYRYPPVLDSAEAAAREIRLAPRLRADLTAELRRQNEGCGPQTAANLDRLEKPDTVVVATGQQVGLFGGPVFAVYKALTAVRFAAELTRRGTPAVPVFWLATEDHDIAEVDHAWGFSRDGGPAKLRAVTEGAAGAAVGTHKIADADLATLEELVRGFPFADEAAALAREAYADAPYFAEAFLALFRKLLCRFGLIFLCPMQREIRRLAAPFIEQAVERSPELTAKLLGRGRELERAGFHRQVHVDDETSLFFLFEKGVRVALKKHGGAYRAGTDRYSTGDLLARLRENPAAFSPNALLRPVMQDFLLPTAALIGGPAELAYLGQSAVLYESLLGRMPAFLPRATFTILDGRAAKLLERYRLTPAECFVPAAEIEERIAASLVPPELHGAFARSAQEIETAMRRTERRLSSFDPSLQASFSLSAGKIRYQLEKIQAKTARESLRRNETAQRHAAYLSGFLYPNRSLQERVYGVLPFLSKFGGDFVDRIAQAITPDCVDHQVLTL